jgi:transcription antitermination factor NusG
MSNTKRAKIVRDFNDAGTETRFTVGATVEISEGAFVNYHAAGLVEEVREDTVEAPAA